MPHTLPISFSMIWSPRKYLVRRTNHESPHHAIFSSLMLLPSLWPKCLPQHPILKHPQFKICPSCDICVVKNHKKQLLPVLWHNPTCYWRGWEKPWHIQSLWPLGKNQSTTYFLNSKQDAKHMRQFAILTWSWVTTGTCDSITMKVSSSSCSTVGSVSAITFTFPMGLLLQQKGR
jgi:hypothetical protein